MKKKPRIIWVVLSIILIFLTFGCGLAVLLGSTDVLSLPGSEASLRQTFSSTVPPSSSNGQAEGDELRAVFIATTLNIDFPSENNLDAAAQKKEADDILDKTKALGLNTVMLQVRGSADAIYKSQLFPWSDVLTGTQGKDPGYDPLEYFIEGAHKRGLKLEAWVNPYRTQRKSDIGTLSATNPAKQHPDWVLKSADGGSFFNPGLPAVRDLIENGVMELVTNYDIDGILFDDYFYPDSSFDDSAAFKQYGGGVELGDWRRNNLTTLISEIHTKIETARSSGRKVIFGISPSGVWANKSSNPDGSDTSAQCESYYDLYADSRLWVKKSYVDYICPQIYWKRGDPAADFTKLLDWWADTVHGTSVKLYIAHAVYKVDGSTFTADEIKAQLEAAAKIPEYGGSAFYGYAQFKVNTGGVADTVSGYYSIKQ